MQSAGAFGPIGRAARAIILGVVHFGPFSKILNKYGKGNFAPLAYLIPAQRAYEIQCPCFCGDLRTSGFIQVPVELA